MAMFSFNFDPYFTMGSIVHLLLTLAYKNNIVIPGNNFHYATAKNGFELETEVNSKGMYKNIIIMITLVTIGGVGFITAIECCLLCCCFSYKKKKMDSPERLLETYREQIRNESNSESYRMELLNKANELAKDIINYHSEQKQSTHIISGGNQEHASSNQEIEMSRRIEDGRPALGPPPPSSNGSSDSPHSPHPATGNGD